MVFSSSYCRWSKARLIVWIYSCQFKLRLLIWLCHTHYLTEPTTSQQCKVLPGYHPWQTPALADGALVAGYHPAGYPSGRVSPAGHHSAGYLTCRVSPTRYPHHRVSAAGIILQGFPPTGYHPVRVSLSQGIILSGCPLQGIPWPSLLAAIPVPGSGLWHSNAPGRRVGCSFPQHHHPALTFTSWPCVQSSQLTPPNLNI